jgi:hypothetical protein
MRRAAAGAATTGGGDSRDRDDVWRWLGRLAARGEGSGGGDGGVALGLSPFFWYFFRFVCTRLKVIFGQTQTDLLFSVCDTNI